MPYITREDGERFIIPSYRDVLSAKKPALLRREILLLCSNYGEYITLQRKNINQYEVAFSTEPGYLLGETVWNYFKRPLDLIYCEEIPNTSEAILVIVKAGIVYLDGTFPLDAIADELIVFRTQQNNFDIYIYGDIPISATPETAKFSFDASSVKSFNVLEKPVFPTLPVGKAFQLQLVNTVLKAKSIGVFPTKQILAGVVSLGLIWMVWSVLTTHKKEVPIITMHVSNPYQMYLNLLNTSYPSTEIHWLVNAVNLLRTIPGWSADTITYSKGKLSASVKSLGARTNLLYQWASVNNARVSIEKNGFFILLDNTMNNRRNISFISPINQVTARLIDSMSYIIPGNNVQVGAQINRDKFYEREIQVDFNSISPTTLDLIGQQFENVPLVLDGVTINIANGLLTGTITLRALGN